MMAATTLEEAKEKIFEATTLLVFEQPVIACFNRDKINAFRTDKFNGFFNFKGYGYTGRNSYFGTKVHLKDSRGELGGIFNMSKYGDLETTNIFMVDDGSPDMVMGYIYEKLWQVDPLTWDPIPGLAYDWNIEPTVANGDVLDGQKFTFYLYENETWHDGTPFTATDVNHSLYLWRTNPFHPPILTDVYKVETPNDFKIELFVNRTGYLEWADSTSFYITPEHIWREIANVSTYCPTIAEVIGTGPFKLNTWVSGESITLLRHKNWRWDIWDVFLFQPFTILSPVGGGNYFGQVLIQWAPIEDSFNHNITYIVAYSPDNGTSWMTLATDLNSTSYIWDSATVTDGDLYLIQVNASCSEGTRQVAISNSTFTIDNISPITTNYPSNQIFDSSNQSNIPFNLLPVLQIFSSVTIISFVIILVVIIRKQRISK
jgi:ABC-type transport system substrate-binding protein